MRRGRVPEPADMNFNHGKDPIRQDQQDRQDAILVANPYNRMQAGDMRLKFDILTIDPMTADINAPGKTTVVMGWGWGGK